MKSMYDARKTKEIFERAHVTFGRPGEKSKPTLVHPVKTDEPFEENWDNELSEVLIKGIKPYS